MTDEPTPASDVLYVLPDTNLFLQARALKELPWNELGSIREIIILVPRAVQKELSRLKSDGNSRRARRSRTASTLLLQTAQATKHTTTLRERDPRVTLKLPLPTKLSALPDDLDLANPDDRIIAEAITFREQNPNKEAVILTGDTDLIVNAIHHDIPYRPIPEHWLLPPEKDKRDKRISELEREIRTLEKAEPFIDITIQNDEGNPVKELAISRDRYEALPETLIEELVSEAQERRPPRQGLNKLVGRRHPPGALGLGLLGVGISQIYKAPTAEEVADYYEREYPNWITHLRSTFTNLHTHLSAPSRSTTATIVLENKGTRPADGVILSIILHGGIQLTRKAPAKNVILPQPPQPPKGHYENPAGFLTHGFNNMGMAQLNRPFLKALQGVPRDPNKFYRNYGDEPTEEWELNCDEFRHGDSVSCGLGIVIPDNWQGPTAGLTIKITARNMSNAATKTVPLHIDTIPRDTTSAARTLLDEQLKRRPTVTVQQLQKDESV